MKTKIIILGVILATSLMLMMPSISAVNGQLKVTKINEIKELTNNFKKNKGGAFGDGRLFLFTFYMAMGLKMFFMPDGEGPKTGLGPRIVGLVLCWGTAFAILFVGDVSNQDNVLSAL